MIRLASANLQEQKPDWSLSSLGMNFASGYLEGLTTFDILKEEAPDTTQEYIARSLGSVLGFIGWLPTPAGVTRIGLAGLGHTMKLLGNASKGVSYLEKAKSIVTLGDKMYSSVPKLVGSIGAKGIERFFETTAAKEAMLFTEKIAGHTFAPATKEITRSLISQATFMGFASAAGARPLSLNPLEYFSAEDFQTRSQAFIQGIPFGLAQGGIASLVTKETLGKMGFKGFEELVKNSPEKAEYILKSIRAVSTGLTMSGYTSLTQDVPIEYTIYEGLLNGVFGWREMPYTMKEAHRLVNKHLSDQNVIHGDLILKSKGDIVKFMNGKGEFPSKGVQKELELLYQHHWGKDFAKSMIPEMVTPEVAKTLGVSMETLEKMPKSDLAAALDQPEFKQFKILRTEIAEQEYNDELSKRIKDFTDTQGRGPTEEEMVQMSEGVYPEVIKTVGEMSPKLFEEVHRIASRVSEAVEGNISYPEKHQAMLKSLEETGVSKQGMRNLLEVLKGDEPRIVTTVDNIFYENKKAGLKEYIPVKDKIQKELGLVLSDEQNKRMNLLWNMYVHSKVSEERRYDIDGNRLIAGRKYNKAGIADMDVRDFYNYETEFDTNVITIKEAEGNIGKRKSRKVVGIHEPWKYYEKGEAKFGQINNNKLLGAIFENGLLPISNRKDNQQILTEKRGSVSFDSETNAYTLNHKGITYRVNVREGFNHIDQAENKTIGESYDSYVKDRIKYVEDNTGKTYQQAMEDPIAVQYYEKAYDEMTANRMLHWIALNRKENLYEVFASTGTLVRGAFPYTTRMQLVAGSGITLDPSVVGKQSVKAIHVFMEDTGVHNAFGESERTQEDGAIVSIGMKQHYMNALGTTDDVAFYKPAIAVSLSTGLHIEKAGDHQATTLNEQKLIKALGDVSYVVNNTTAKNPGDIPMVKLSVVNGEYIVKDMLGNILSPEQIEKMKFDLPVNSIRLNPSVTEDSEMPQLHYIKQMFGNVPELQNYIDENIIKPSLEGIEEVNNKFDILKTGEDINLDDVGAQGILDAMHGKDFYKAGPKTIAVVKRLLNYVFDKGDIIEGDGEGELSSYLERLRTSVELAVNATGIDNITAAFLRERNVRDYLEQAMYKYITDRAHRPVHKGFGSSSRIFYGLSPVDAEAFKVKHGREFQQGDLLLGEAERNQRRLIPEELKGLFSNKSNIKTQDKITRQDLKSNPDTQYLFGDNLEGTGFGGQAKEMRGEKNAIGIPTKKKPSNTPDSFFTDTEFEQNKLAIDNAITKIDRNKSIIIPKSGIGTGLADLKNKAPKTFEYLQEQLKGLEQFKSKNTVTLGEVWDMYQKGNMTQQVFTNYKGGFENVGKGTSEGDGKDKAMRQIADGGVFEVAHNKPSSTSTSAKVIGIVDQKGKTVLSSKNFATPSKIVMLARNGELSGKPLEEATKNTIKDRFDEGAKFVVGDMPNVDSQFIDYLKELGAEFTVYHTGNKSRIKVESTVRTNKESELLEDFFSRTIGTRSPQSDASGSRRLTFRGFYGPGHGATIHPLDMKYLDGADLDGDAVKLYFGMGKEFVNHIEQPHIKHRFSRFFSSPEERDSFFSRTNIHAGKTVKDFSPEDLKLVLSTGKDSKGAKYLEEFAMEKGHNPYLKGYKGGEPSSITKIISGGQTGIDRLGLEVGKSLGLETGGTAPAGYRTENGNDISLKDFGLKEHQSRDWLPRTEENVKQSDGTVYFATDEDSAGLHATRRYAITHNKPFILNPTKEQMKNWIGQYKIKTLNVAGNRGSKLTKEMLETARSVINLAITEVGDQEFTNLKRTYSMFSPTLIMEAGRQATVGKNNLGWGLASGNRGRVLGHYLRAGGRVEVGKGDYYLIAKSDKEEFNRTIWDIVNSCADATKGKNPPVDPETMRIVGGVLSVADVLDSKGKPADILGFINHIKSKGLGEVPILKELTEVDNNLRLRDFEGNKKHLQDIFYNLNMAVNKAKSVMPGSDFGSVWYKSAERLAKLRYEPEPLDFTNIIQSDIVRRQFDRLAKSDAPISKFAIRALGRAGVNFNNSYIAQTPIWRDIVQQYKGSDVELLNDFINPPGKGSTYLNSKAWEIAAKMPNPVRGKDPINRQSELQAQLIETSVKKLKEDAKLYPDKRSVTYELKDGRTKVEIFDTEEDAKAWLEENSWSDGKIGRVERSKGEQTKYIQELWANDYTDMNSLAFTIDYLSKYVDTKLLKENLTDENVTKLLEDKIRPFARTVSKLKSYVLNTQQGIVNTKSERTDPETGKVLFKTPQERQESFKYWEEALEKTVKYRESLDAPERQLFDALWLSSLDFNEKVDINNQAKVKAASEGDSSQENIDKIANEMIVEEANTKFDTRRGYTALVSGIADPEMIKAYYQKYAKLAGIMTQDNVSMEVLADAMNISELNGNLPHFITHNPEFASINMRPALDKEAREYMAPFKQWFLEKHGKNQLGNIKDPIARIEFNDLRTRARKLLKDVPEQLYDFALNFPDIMSKKYGMAFSWTADLMTKQDFKLYLDYLEGRKFNPNETPKVGKSWFLQKFGRVAQSAERLQKEIDKFKLQVLRPVITGEGPVSRFLTQNVLGHYAMLYEAQKAYATAQNAVRQISEDTYKKNLPLNDTFNKQHDGIADKIVRIVAARDIEKPFAKSIITKDENGNDVVTKNEFLINYEKAVKDYDALPNTKYRITAPDGSTISMNKQEMAAYIHKGILAYNQENISRWSNRPGDKLLVYGDKEYGKNRVRLVDVQKTNMKRVEESMKITVGQEDMSVMAMTELAAAMKLENNLFDVYTTPQGIFFDSQMGPEQREIFDKNVKQNIRGYTVDFKKKFSNMSAVEQDAVMDQLYPNGKIAGFNLGEKLDMYGDSYWHHMTLNRKVITEHLKKKLAPILKTLPPEEAKKLTQRVLKQVGRTTRQEDDINGGQEFMGQLFDKGDPIRSLHIHPNKILGERDMDDPIPQWDLSINAVITAHEVLLKMQHDMSFALTANYLVNDARKRMVFGEGTKHLANWMERYARQVMGFQDTTPPELEQGYNYGLPTNWMKFHNNAYWSKKITEIGDSWFGRKIFPEYNQLTAIAENINFVKEKKKRSEMTQSERDWNDKENARLRKQWIEQSKKNLSEQKITWLSQAEAKWSLMSLLTSFKTAITNVTTAEVMTFMNAGADAYIRSFRLKDIQDEFGSNIIKTKEDAQTILQTIGGLESFYYNDAGMDPSVRKAVHTTIGNLIHDATTKKWSDIQIVQAAKDAGVYDTILNKAAWFMKKSERVARGHSMLAHYINARRTFRHAGFELEYDDPWIMQIAREGVKSSQFLYSNGERPEFMATPMGKIFHRFQLFAYNSVEFRYNTIKAAQLTGIGPGSNDMARFQRMMACDLFMFGMASLVPFSIFGSTLPAPYNGLQNSLTYVFGTNDEKRKSFFSSLPYPANIIQPIVPPGLRAIPQLFGLFVPGNGTTTQKVEDIVVGMMPFQRIGKDISRTLDNPVMLIDNMTGIPFIKIPQINRDLSNMTTFDEYLNRYRSRAYLPESKKIEKDINSYLEQYPSP